MGWASGSFLASKVWSLFRNYIPEGEERTFIANELIALFEQEDCDTLDEAIVLWDDAGRRVSRDIYHVWKEKGEV